MRKTLPTHLLAILSKGEQHKAERETQQYEEYKQRNKPTKFSYVGTAGGGELGTMDEASARMQQIRMHNMHSKTSRLLKNQERKGQMKQLEDQELEQKKAEARRKAELNSQREAERANTARSDMRRVNNKFLDRLEAQSKAATATCTQTQQQTSHPQQCVNPSGPAPSRHPGQQPTSQAGQPRTSVPAGGRGSQTTSQQSNAGAQPRFSQSRVTASSTLPSGPAPSRHPGQQPPSQAERFTTSNPAGQLWTSVPAGGRGSQTTSSQSNAGPQPRVSQSRVTASSTSPSYSDRHVSTESQPQPVNSSFEEQPADDEFFDNLDQLVSWFPEFDENMLYSILQQCNGSLDQAMVLLQ